MATLSILCVDDEPEMRSLAALSLQLDPDVEVKTAGGGAEALALLDGGAWSPDVFLLDVLMPDMDGPDVLARLRQRARFADTPVIFVTSRAREANVSHLLSLGAAGVIAKPYAPQALATAVRSLMAGGPCRVRMKDAFAALRDRFLERCEEDRRSLEAVRADLAGRSHIDILRLIHRLAGAGGTFGFPALSRLAREAEEKLRDGRGLSDLTLAGLLTQLQSMSGSRTGPA